MAPAEVATMRPDKATGMLPAPKDGPNAAAPPELTVMFRAVPLMEAGDSNRATPPLRVMPPVAAVLVPARTNVPPAGVTAVSPVYVLLPARIIVPEPVLT